MNIIGIIVGIAIIAGLLLAMGKMSEQGVDINDQFGCADGGCSSCSAGAESAESCTHYRDLEQLHLNSSRKE